MRLRKPFAILKAAAAAAAVLFIAAWFAAPYLVDDPLEILAERTPVRVFRDSDGMVARVERTWDHQWRIDIPLDEVSPNVKRIMLTTEDANFYRHHGIDYLAMARAAWQDVTSLRIVSGSSTITMQLAGLSDERRRRTLPWKFKQAAQARLLERRYSKDRILREYLNRIPMGGQIYGIEAASRYYFGRPASELNLPESALLCGIPQSPARFRPDRHRDAALRRMEIVLQLLERRGGITREEAVRVRREERLRFRDFDAEFDLRRLEIRENSIFFWERARREAGGESGAPLDLATTLDSVLQAQMLALLRAQRDRLQNVRDGAGIVIDNRTGAILSYVGTLEFDGIPDGQVDGASATRGAGSSLKPFIYAEAVEGGIIVSKSKMLDTPTRFGGYMPVNYDGAYRGFVTAGDALSLSLNTPAVRLLATLGEKRVMNLMERIGILSDRAVKWNGLALALGSAGHTLADIAGGYACLAREGTTVRLHALASIDGNEGSRRIFSEGSAAMVSMMIRTPLDGTMVDCAWKTGTSHRNHDAWCFAYTPEYTVGIWMGNKTGAQSPALVGATAAAPVAAEAMNVLYPAGRRPVWPPPSARFDTVRLCTRSGLLAAASCPEAHDGEKPRGIPLRPCDICSGRRKFSGFKIVTPLPGTYRAGTNGVARLHFSAGEPAYWFDNASPLGHHNLPWDCELEPGHHAITASPDSGDDPSTVNVVVTE